MSSIQQANFYAGGGTVRSMATNLYNLPTTGKKMSANDQGFLAQLTNPGELLGDKNSAAHRHFLKQFGGDESKLADYVNGVTDSNRSGPLGDLGSTLGMDFSDLSNTKNRLDFNKKITAEDAKKAFALKHHKTYKNSEEMDRLDSMTVAYQSLKNSEGGHLNSAEAEAGVRATLGMFGDVTTKGSLKDQSAGTQERRMAVEMAKREAVNDKIRHTAGGKGGEPGMEDIMTAMFTNMDKMSTAMTDKDKGIGKDMSDLTSTTKDIFALLELTLGKNIKGDDINKRMLLDQLPPPIIATDGNNGVITPNVNHTNRRADRR
jgi:hypothetical protein